jgi:hypothetical protein
MNWALVQVKFALTLSRLAFNSAFRGYLTTPLLSSVNP